LVAGDHVAPFVEWCASYIDARSGGDRRVARAIIRDIKVALRGAEIFGVIALAGDGHGLREASRAGGELAQLRGAGVRAQGYAAEAGHAFDAGDWFQGSQKNASGVACGLTADVRTVVISVDEINICMAGRTKEDSIARSPADVGVSARVAHAKVGFGFDNASGEQKTPLAAHEEFAEKIPCDVARIARIESSGQRREAGEALRSERRRVHAISQSKARAGGFVRCAVPSSGQNDKLPTLRFAEGGALRSLYRLWLIVGLDLGEDLFGVALGFNLAPYMSYGAVGSD